ncbi:hypothetical protein V8C44DRAFT_47671 [Trichoderma aethiopicum]
MELCSVKQGDWWGFLPGFMLLLLAAGPPKSDSKGVGRLRSGTSATWILTSCCSHAASHPMDPASSRRAATGRAAAMRADGRVAC